MNSLNKSNATTAKKVSDEPVAKKTKPSDENSLCHDQLKTLKFENDELKKLVEEKQQENDELKEGLKNSQEAIKTLEDKLLSLPLPKGARVFAVMGKTYFPAIVVNSYSSNGGYDVIFNEHPAPQNVLNVSSVFPLFLIKEGNQVFVLGKKNNHGVRGIFIGKVLEIPDIQDKEKWQHGIYTVKVWKAEHPHPGPEIREIKWSDMFLMESQCKEILNGKPAIPVFHECLITCPRTADTTTTPLNSASFSVPLQDPTSSKANSNPECNRFKKPAKIQMDRIWVMAIKALKSKKLQPNKSTEIKGEIPQISKSPKA